MSERLLALSFVEEGQIPGSLALHRTTRNALLDQLREEDERRFLATSATVAELALERFRETEQAFWLLESLYQRMIAPPGEDSSALREALDTLRELPPPTQLRTALMVLLEPVEQGLADERSLPVYVDYLLGQTLDDVAGLLEVARRRSPAAYRSIIDLLSRGDFDPPYEDLLLSRTSLGDLGTFLRDSWAEMPEAFAVTEACLLRPEAGPRWIRALGRAATGDLGNFLARAAELSQDLANRSAAVLRQGEGLRIAVETAGGADLAGLLQLLRVAEPLVPELYEALIDQTRRAGAESLASRIARSPTFDSGNLLEHLETRMPEFLRQVDAELQGSSTLSTLVAKLISALPHRRQAFERYAEDHLPILHTRAAKALERSKTKIQYRDSLHIEEVALVDWKAAVLRTHGYINNQGGEELANAFYRLRDQGFETFFFDLSDTKIVNSIGISILIEVIEDVVERDLSLAFCSLHPTIYKTFVIMGLAQYAPVYATETDAFERRRLTFAD